MQQAMGTQPKLVFFVLFFFPSDKRSKVLELLFPSKVFAAIDGYKNVGF